MQKPIFPTAVIALLLLAPLAQAGNSRAAARLDRLLGATRSLTARFTETVVNANAATVRQASGYVAIAKPGRFRWDYRKPYRQLIVADGKTLWIYDPGLEQVTVKPEPGALAAGPAALLAGEADISRNFRVSLLPRHGGLDWLRLVPRSKNADYTAIELGLAAHDEIRVMRLVSRLGQTTRIKFSDVRRNPAIPVAQFRFVPPAGVDVVRDTSPPGPSTGGS